MFPAHRPRRRPRSGVLALAGLLALLAPARSARAHGGLHYHLEPGTRWSYHVVSAQQVRLGERETRARLELDLAVRVRRVSGGVAELVVSIERGRGEATVDGRSLPHLAHIVPSLRRATLVFTLDERGRIARTQGWHGAPPPLLPLLENLRRQLELVLPRFEAGAAPRPGARWEATVEAPAGPGERMLVTRAQYEVRAVRDAEVVLAAELAPRVTDNARRRGVTARGSGEGRGELVFDRAAGALKQARLELRYVVQLERGKERLAQQVKLSLELRRR